MRSEEPRLLSSQQIGAIVVIAIHVVVIAAGDAERLAAVQAHDAGKRPSVQQRARHQIKSPEVIRLPDEGDDRLIPRRFNSLSARFGASPISTPFLNRPFFGWVCFCRKF
jgi:hypothetical protein